jgi:intracellular sulfur oxidation DsrE/DsrF family protein
MKAKYFAGVCLALIIALPVVAGEANFTKGPVFKTLGAVAAVEADIIIPQNAKFAVAFDTSKAATSGKVNRSLETAARFMNMHVAAGVRQDDIKLAVVIHGKAVFDMTKEDVYGETYEGASNANKPVIKALTDQGIRLIVCGQSAAYYDVEKSDLLSGVELALSAMTAHALLQQHGYTLNPF